MKIVKIFSAQSAAWSPQEAADKIEAQKAKWEGAHRWYEPIDSDIHTTTFDNDNGVSKYVIITLKLTYAYES